MRRAQHQSIALRKQKMRLEKLKPNVNQNRRNIKHGSVYDIARVNPNSRICIIRSLGGIGDVLMTMPGVMALKKEFPNINLTYALDRVSTNNDTYYNLIRNASFIDNFIDARFVDKRNYDGVADITSVCIRYEHSSKPPLNRIDIFARALGFSSISNHVPFYKVEPDEYLYAEQLLSPHRGKKFVFLHTASFDQKRSWPPNRYLELIKLTEATRPDILFLLSDFNNCVPSSYSLSNVLNVTNQDIRKVAATIKHSNLFVGPDSGLMHLAGALIHPSLVLFGSIPPSARINYYKNHQAIEAKPKLSCQYCWYNNCNIGFKCMKDISAKQVYNRILERL